MLSNNAGLTPYLSSVIPVHYCSKSYTRSPEVWNYYHKMNLGPVGLNADAPIVKMRLTVIYVEIVLNAINSERRQLILLVLNVSSTSFCDLLFGATWF